MILIIKGDFNDALLEAKTRGIKLRELRMTHQQETMAVAERDQQDLVYRWFNEGNYGPGTLLWFTFARSED